MVNWAQILTLLPTFFIVAESVRVRLFFQCSGVDHNQLMGLIGYLQNGLRIAPWNMREGRLEVEEEWNAHRFLCHH